MTDRMQTYLTTYFGTLAVLVGLWVLRKLLRTVRAWRRRQATLEQRGFAVVPMARSTRAKSHDH